MHILIDKDVSLAQDIRDPEGHEGYAWGLIALLLNMSVHLQRILPINGQIIMRWE